MNRFVFLLVVLSGVGIMVFPAHAWTAKTLQTTVGQKLDTVPQANTHCQNCHTRMRLDSTHGFACTVCHAGDGAATGKEQAHQGLITEPAHPDNMKKICGRCHAQEVAKASQSLHFTLQHEVNLVRRHFGATSDVQNPLHIPLENASSGKLALADDMLRRRCLRCHVYSHGDAYAAVTHGTGCASCHLVWKDGKMANHEFRLPKDAQCLSCHYENRVGMDYYGRYEHDFNHEYRTPYTPDTTNFYPSRPYGVEYHDLTPDIHQQHGLVCIDCHRHAGHPNTQDTAVACLSCHGWKPGQKPVLNNLRVEKRQLVLQGAADGKLHTVPMLKNPAHVRYDKQVACQVCHGQWSYNDSPVSLIRLDKMNVSEWADLTVQGSFEMEQLLQYNALHTPERPLMMRDGLTGQSRPGVWLKGFGQRRWQPLMLERDPHGVVQVVRPVLDLRLSMVDGQGRVVFDNVSGQGAAWLPYTPHTTGHAGIFYFDRLRRFFPSQESSVR